MKRFELYAVNTLGGDQDTLDRLMREGITEERREKTERYRFFNDKLRSVLAERLLFFGLKEWGINEKEVDIKYGLHNKPQLYGNQMPFFNISHSGNWVICAFFEAEVGCDIEIVKKADMGVAERFYEEKEFEGLLAASEGEMRDKAFFWYWTRHESYGKYTGEGFTDHIDAGSVEFYEVELDPGYACNVCIGREDAIKTAAPKVIVKEIWEI